MTLLAALSAAIWLCLVFARGGFWRVSPDLLPFPARPATLPSVLAVVPARNEAAVVGETLPSLLAQDYPGRFHVVLVDDDSDDGTGTLAAAAAGRIGLSGRLTVLGGAPLPAGWTGKLWAMNRGVEHAGGLPEPPELLLFTDADIRYEPGVLSALVAQAQARRTVLCSLMVKLRMESPAERWLVPAFVYFFRMLYPFGWVRRQDRACAAAAGGCMLVHREALAAAGGIGAIRGALIDDCALGALMKRVGPVWLGLSANVHSVRPYPGVADIRAMVSRSAYAELRYSPVRLLAALSGLALVFLVPPLALAFGDLPAKGFGLLAWASMAASFVPMMRFYNAPWWTAPGLPLISAAYVLFTLDSAVAYRQGRGGAWKGRVQAQMESSSSS